MSFSFGVQKDPIYGTYGEFSIGSKENKIRAQFLLTKMKPGSAGNWENTFASQMIPWREVFNVEELTFDELLQRDLDDSRVAHDLIPYLLGESGDSARFFPPILAVLVPKKHEKTGIQPYYPTPTQEGKTKLNFGNLFEFEKAIVEGEVSPLGVIKYNRHQAAFMIVDGQHRAMAILALHRQINQTWKGNRYATFYQHLKLQEDQIKHIELPICVVFFPDLHETNQTVQDQGIDLKSVCREIFLVVNKSAKSVSQSRELLLDDEDLAARMMRETLSKLKDRGEDKASLARIYSFAFGDNDASKQEVVVGQLEYTSAVALHKMHCAAVFGVRDAFEFNREKGGDITDGRRIQNSKRPVTLLRGTALEDWPSLARRSGKTHSPQDIQDAVHLLAQMTDAVLFPLFDRFRPFAVHNAEMRALRTRLQDPDMMANPTQQKCFSLLFEGSGVRTVFESHLERLKKRKKAAQEEGTAISDYTNNQLKDAKGIESAWHRHREDLKKSRAARLFYIDPERFFENPDNHEDWSKLLHQANSVYDTVSTQAFQLGYLMAVHSVVELMVYDETPYEQRLGMVQFVANLFIDALNAYFSSSSAKEHRSYTGLVKESRANVFNRKALGLRGLLMQSVAELNEKQWVFFRYAVLEMVHCKHTYRTVQEQLEQASDLAIAQRYREVLPNLIGHLLTLRKNYIEAAQQKALESADFKQEVQVLQAKLQGAGKLDTEITEAVNAKQEEKRATVQQQCRENIQASLGEFLSQPDKLINRLFGDSTGESWDDA
ncbi:DNA sulfur modification protein DndB [Spirulina sp. CS-785/01]|uniref:DNA sulfur modification protein DndB n=1 Tax=Spirulina sp. CS-785/01 TaxID=3021716 RepID=UPI00232B0F8A|nr:DNA sulfur modification protein DndB [Spirulina sp. CS-785/01]MDB9314132.1 DNA sulfur modification protein DndB [Spirulina sp. CS-785/01]